jgi:long-chain acyl-CoA synthetase
MKRVADILLEGAGRFGSRQALADPVESATYAQLGAQASQLGRALQKLGLEPGERGLVVLPNSVNFVRAHFANVLAGLISVPCDASLTADSLAALAASCMPSCLLTDPASLARLTEKSPLPECIREVVVFAANPPKPLGVVRVSLAPELMAAQPGDLFDRARGEKEIAALMYTTGTTGRPKGVQLTNANILAALHSIVEFADYKADDREVVILPLSHNFGIGHVYCNLMSGGAVYTENGLARAGRVLKAVESFGATGFPGTPMGFGLLIDQYGPVLAQKARNLRFSVINSAPLPPERTVQLQRLLPQLDIMIYYGLTEASRTSFISLTKAGPDYYRCAGRPMKHVEVQIHGAECAVMKAGEQGEVVIRGPAVSRGYWGNPEENCQVFREGWMHTGDLGHLDPQGYLWITGRIKDVINVGGYKVNPAEVERVLLTWPGVRDAAAVGLEGVGGFTGENVVAALVGDAGFVPDEAALLQHCLASLEKFKVPARFVAVPEISRSNTGKIKRAELARQVAAALGPKLPATT